MSTKFFWEAHVAWYDAIYQYGNRTGNNSFFDSFTGVRLGLFSNRKWASAISIRFFWTTGFARIHGTVNLNHPKTYLSWQNTRPFLFTIISVAKSLIASSIVKSCWQVCIQLELQVDTHIEYRAPLLASDMWSCRQQRVVDCIYHGNTFGFLEMTPDRSEYSLQWSRPGLWQTRPEMTVSSPVR